MQTPPVITIDFLYLRHIGDRNISEDDFRKIQTDRVSEMQNWANILRSQEEDKRIKLAIVAANNHYARFGPGTAYLFCGMINLRPVNWEQRSAKDTF
jgi:hypothetical protein